MVEDEAELGNYQTKAHDENGKKMCEIRMVYPGPFWLNIVGKEVLEDA